MIRFVPYLLVAAVLLVLFAALVAAGAIEPGRIGYLVWVAIAIVAAVGGLIDRFGRRRTAREGPPGEMTRRAEERRRVELADLGLGGVPWKGRVPVYFLVLVLAAVALGAVGSSDDVGSEVSALSFVGFLVVVFATYLLVMREVKKRRREEREARRRRVPRAREEPDPWPRFAETMGFEIAEGDEPGLEGTHEGFRVRLEAVRAGVPVTRARAVLPVPATGAGRVLEDQEVRRWLDALGDAEVVVENGAVEAWAPGIERDPDRLRGLVELAVAAARVVRAA